MKAYFLGLSRSSGTFDYKNYKIESSLSSKATHNVSKAN